jgi:hypothetical protein
MNKSRILTRLVPWMFIAMAQAQTLIDLRTQSKSVDFSAAASTKPLQMGSSLPATCVVGQVFFLNSAPLGGSIYACNPTNAWSVQGLVVPPGSANEVASSNGTSVLWVALNGDISGPPNSVSVMGIQNRPVAAAPPANGQALVWNSANSNWQPGTVTGALTSVFGRSGVVTAQTGDYSLSQISGNFGGDLSGAPTSATVVAINGHSVANTLPTNGQALVWSSSANQWQPVTITGTGGASMASQLGDFSVTLSSPTVLNIGPNCSSATPCNIRFGYQVFSITQGATATLSGNAAGTAYIYVTSTGNLFVGHNLTITCSAGCTQQSGITSFPANVIPIFTWTASNGMWNSTGGADQRSMLSTKVLANGPGIVLAETPGQSTLSVDNGVIPTYLTNAATLNFSAAIASGACAPDQTMTVSGADTGDAVAPAWPSGLSSGLLGMMFVSSSNTITVRLCNFSGSTVTPGSASYRATIVRNY